MDEEEKKFDEMDNDTRVFNDGFGNAAIAAEVHNDLDLLSGDGRGSLMLMFKHLLCLFQNGPKIS